MNKKEKYPVSFFRFLKTSNFLLFLILLFALVIRFYHFNTRFGLGGDDARDVMIALEALRLHNLPMIGSFASAGPFVFGPLYYYILMLIYILFPFSPASPWFVIDLFGVLTVFIFYKIGKSFGGTRLGIITALFAAFSTQLINKSLTVGQHSLSAFFAPLTVWIFLLLFDKKKIWVAFLLGLVLGAGVDIHYQILNLMLFLPAILFIPGINWKDKILSFCLAGIGFLIMMTPLIYWDSYQGFANTRNILGYLLIGQNEHFVPNSWTLFISQYLPNLWSYVIGGFQPTGLILSVLTVFLLLFIFVSKKMDKKTLILSTIFALLLFIDRYYSGQRTDFYFLYLNPFIILFSAWTVNYFLSIKNYFSVNPVIVNISKFLGFIFIAVMLFGSMSINVQILSHDNGMKSLRDTEQLLQNKFPNKKFYIYDYHSRTFPDSSALSFLMGYDGLIAKDGIPIGIGDCNGISCPNTQDITITRVRGSLMTDLSRTGYSPTKLGQLNWSPVDQDIMYSDLIGWSEKHELKSQYSWNDLLQAAAKKVKL